MATTNLSSYKKTDLPDATQMRIGIVVSEWNEEITGGLLAGCRSTLIDCGLAEDNIIIEFVPGSYELPFGAQLILQLLQVDAVICLGSVIRGETPHFEFVCEAVAQGVKDVSLKFSRPVIFGVLTDNTIEQSRARSGGALGNKGVEAAITAIKMADLQSRLS